MPEIIRNGRVEADAWHWVDFPSGAGTPLAPPAPTDRVIVSLGTWKRHREAHAGAGPRGVWLAPHDDPTELAPDLRRIALVAVHFPKFTDGRGYSTAVVLRTRLAFEGELRAIGDVGRDQLFQLRRCGFDSFQLAPHRDPRAALASLADFSLRYQASVDDPLPLFRKRLAARGQGGTHLASAG